MEILLATWNRQKLAWMANGLQQVGLPIHILRDGEIPEAEESGKTCEENALLKVREVRAAKEARMSAAHRASSSLPTLSENKATFDTIIVGEDSGLFIDALNGFPGVRTARFAAGTDNDRSQIILERMLSLKEGQRKACFVSVVAVQFPDGQEDVYRGEFHGEISFAPMGTLSEGYARIFQLLNGQTLASLNPAQWEGRDHRRQALSLASAGILKWLEPR
ncbi:non-canonical purine NTP pyrophosphatase [Paenibacillus radicis (ex Xue et al. 2023)]|uniref:Non-canonical purine NTP pyrophosphatase n=1 Tax=Paenibacillus radicis (ex Xue et al. 2023) TaxID=2972489 RepID=A0ABT1YKE8_9BACL|nr:non-canonical purine NTP pyrophosphatase [Paenibacillus radicis (ex Xue et al. 2023)]MCR8633664.1 non-canonical purine NTP pyrophosphatase [Paenibacillus radicis (ex Xue et al. 2023)]